MTALEQERRIRAELLGFRSQIEIPDAEFPEALARALNEIHEMLFNEDLRVDSVMADLGISPSRAYELFHEHLDTTPHAYIERLRIRAALRLLSDPSLHLTNICFGLGYANYRTFARAFERVVDTCPQMLRHDRAGVNSLAC